MNEPAMHVRDSYAVMPSEAADALSRTVIRAQMTGVGGGVVDRVDRAFDGVGIWSVRLLFAGVPLAVGIYLLVATEWRQLGLIAVGASVVVLLLVIGFQRLQGRFERAIDSKADAMIARSGRAGLQDAIERGELGVLHGDLEAELIGGTLRVRGGGRTLTIPDVHAGWHAAAGGWLVVGAAAPDLSADHAGYVALPAAGKVAAAILAGRQG